MPFFDNIGKKVGEVASNAAKKSNEFIELNKLNSSIGGEEEKIKKIYTEIGSRLYANYCNSQEGLLDYADLCEEINTHQNTINELKVKINELKGGRVCTACNVEIENGTVFCPNCGAKQENSRVEASAPIKKVCNGCGNELAEDAVFCGSCGQRVEK